MIDRIKNQEMFPTYDISKYVSLRPELMGTKDKFWYYFGDSHKENHLFKIGRPNTGENWSEKVCCELAKMIKLPCANYDFAVCNDQLGVTSKQFFDANSSFQAGNTLLARFDKEYDETKRFKHLLYTLPSVLATIVKFQRKSAPQCVNGIEMKDEEIFVGYLIFDSWVGNTDRHHENWGLIATTHGDGSIVKRLAPSFDHASSLGRELTDHKKTILLHSNDQSRNIQAYSARARSAFFGNDRKTMLQVNVLSYLHQKYPRATKAWGEIICSISSEDIYNIFLKIDESYISRISIEYSTQLLKINTINIRRICLEQ